MKSKLVDSSTGELEEQYQYYYQCPNCGALGIAEYDSYCHYCGQKLRWRKDLLDKRDAEIEKQRAESEKRWKEENIKTEKEKERIVAMMSDDVLGDNIAEAKVIKLSFSELMERYAETNSDN